MKNIGIKFQEQRSIYIFSLKHGDLFFIHDRMIQSNGIYKRQTGFALEHRKI